MHELRDEMPEMAAKIEGLSWVEDGIARRSEFNAVRGLIRLAHAGYAQKLLEEPWVVDGRNYPALESLWYLVVNNPDTLTKIMSHPTISDGITDQEAKVVAVLYEIHDPDLLDKLLDPEQVSLEERTITLPLAGVTELTIIRTRPGLDHTMDSLEHSARSIEEFMGIPFPRRQVIYLLAQIPEESGGLNFGTHVSVAVDEQAQSREWMLELIAHEAGHYYWDSPPNWVAEGASHVIASVASNTLEGTLLSEPCEFTQHIAGLLDLLNGPNPPPGCDWCNYSLGERFFRDLYRNMDETTFRQAFRRLYLHTEFNLSGDECSDDTSICHVKEAFLTLSLEETVPIVERVIARWYDGTGSYDFLSIHGAPVEVDIPVMEGRIEGAYLSFSSGGTPISVITAEPGRSSIVYINLEYSYQTSSGLDFLPIEIVLTYEDGFEFLRKRSNLSVLYPDTRWTHNVGINYETALGRYWVHAYWGEQKIAETTFEIVPAPDPYSIRGVVTGPDGPLPAFIVLEAFRGEENFWVRAKLDGTFEIVASTGIFQLQVEVPVQKPDGRIQNVFVGWYDGKGGITTVPTEAAEIVVDEEDVEGIEIMLPSASYAKFWGQITGPDDLQPAGQIALVAKRGEESIWIDTEPYASFNVGMPTGSYILEIRVRSSSEWHFLGWYDGIRSITTDPDKAFEVVIDDADVNRIEITLPKAPQDLLCPSGASRSTQTGRCGS